MGAHELALGALLPPVAPRCIRCMLMFCALHITLDAIADGVI